MADRDRFFRMAQTYDRMCRSMVPGYDLLQDEILAMVRRETTPQFAIDLGAGSGILLEKILDRFPETHCLWIDYSDNFQAVARKRLERFGDRVGYCLSRIEDNWEDQLQDQPDLIVSSSAIHHLESDEKRTLYARCFNILASGGHFFNIDEMETLSPEATLASFRRWVAYVAEQETALLADRLDDYRAWREPFDGWTLRNVDGFGRPKEKGDDLHEPFVRQVDWLREIGFCEADVFLKYHLWCAIGGSKP